MFFNKIARFNTLASLIHKILWRGSARAEQFSADQSPEAPTSWYLRRAEAVGFEPTGVLPPLVFKTSAFVRSAIPPNGSWDYIRDSMKGSYNVRAKRLLWYAPSPTTTGGGELPPVSLRSPGFGIRLETPPRQRAPLGTDPSLPPRRDLTPATAP